MAVLGLLSNPTLLHAACTGCTNFGPGLEWGTVSISQLVEASGLAASRRNAGVIWTHNDGDRQAFYAVSTNGARLATLNLPVEVGDVEDIAVGPGPVPGISYLYLGDIGGNSSPGDIRNSVRVLRVPEPHIELAWATAPRTLALEGVDGFTLPYPDGTFDAETLLVDPLTGDLFVVTKQEDVARLYRASLAGLTNNGTRTLVFQREIAFDVATGGDISPDGTQILLRREDFARIWQRCDGEPVSLAFNRAGVVAPIVGPPNEPNGEGITFLADSSGYVTISEGEDPSLYYFPARCPAAPRITVSLTNVSAFVGGQAEFRVGATGFPAPSFSWRFGSALLAGRTNSSLVLSSVALSNAGQYLVVASNASGTATSMATLIVRPRPDLRITEVQSVPATGSGWDPLESTCRHASLSIL